MIHSNNQHSSQYGVSPVIGVVLMVAVTVILAGIVGAFFLGLVGTNVEEPEASVTFNQNYELVGSNYEQTEEIQVELQSASRADSVWVEEYTGQSVGYVSTQITPTNSDSDLGGSAAYGPSATAGASSDGDQQYLLTRAEDNSYSGGIGNTVTVDTSGTTEGVLIVIAEQNGNLAVIRTYEYDNS